MALILDGTNGLSDVDGTAGTPAIRGSDANTGIFFPAADTIAFAEGGVESMRLDSNGNVGIGVTPSAWTTNTSSTLQIRRTSFAGLSDYDLHLTSNAFFDGAWKYIAGGVAVTNYFQNGGTHVWRYAGAGTAGNSFAWNEAMRIDSSGNLLVGTTTGPARVTAVGPNDSGCLYLESNAPSGPGGQITMVNTGRGAKYLRIATGNQWEIVNDAYTAVIFQVTNAGQTYNATGTYGTISDVRLKENIVDARSYIDDLCRLRVVKYSLKSENSETPTMLGLVAQEVEEVFPGLVDTSQNQLAGLDDLKQVKMSVLTPMLLKAIQEQQAIIQSLTARIEALENQT